MPWPGWLERELSRRQAIKIGAVGLAPFLGVKFGAMSGDYGYRSIRLQAVELEKTADFYGSTLGLPVKKDGKNVVLSGGSTEIVFEPAKEKSVYHFAFNIPENKIESALEWTKKRTQVVNKNREIFHFESWNAHALYFFDPAGNIVEFIARHTLPNAAKGAFSIKEVLYASELGMVVEDVPKAVEQIEKTLQMSPYKGTSSEFAAVGDEHALLIVVKKGRLWFGTDDLPATIYPASAEIAGAARKSLDSDPYRISLARS